MILSYLSKDWPELEQWRVLGRAKMQELLAYNPKPVLLDPRISAGVNAGWMTTFVKQIDNHLRHHTWMVYIPGQLERWLAFCILEICIYMDFRKYCYFKF